MERKTGHVKWFNARKGYGFLVCGSEDIFVHHSALGSVGYRYLVPGEYVEFILAPVAGKPSASMASDVTGIGGGPLMCEARKTVPVKAS